MKEIVKAVFSSCTAIILLLSCNSSNNKVPNNTRINSSKKYLAKQQLGKSSYYISVPPDYSIRTSDGPDFLVYYFSPKDTVVKDKCTGGLYFGNFPRAIEAENDSCQTEVRKGKMLDTIQDWTIYNCHESYSIQTIINNKKADGWNQKIHAFGQASSRGELDLLLAIYSTLLKKGE